LKTVVVAGNPKPSSRTLDAATLLAHELTGSAPDAVIDVVTLGPGLLGWGDAAVAEAVGEAASADVLVVASPTFKATYSGVLKLFLDQFATAEGMYGVVAVPLMLGAGPGHAMAPDLLLKPVLVELGASCPAPGLYLIDRNYAEDPALAAYVARWAPRVRAAAAVPASDL
jgi:FMN reductase